MIAYNHYIKFIPELKNDKKMKGTFTDIITIKQSKEKIISNEKQNMRYVNNQGREISVFSDGEYTRTIEGQTWGLKVKDVVTFKWVSEKSTIEYVPDKNFTYDLLEYWSLHIVLPLFFTLEEKYDFLHSGGVDVNGKAILFIADSGGGKSTMTDYFIQQGHDLISDDKIGTYLEQDIICAVASHPHHRPYRKSEDLGFFINNVMKQPKPIYAIYELIPSNEYEKIKIVEVIDKIEKFKLLRSNTSMDLDFLEKLRFERLMMIAKYIPIYKVTIPWNLNRLNEVYKYILKNQN